MFLVSRVLMIFQACGAKRPVEVIAASAPIIKVEVSSAIEGQVLCLLRAARLIGDTSVSVSVRRLPNRPVIKRIKKGLLLSVAGNSR
jgi:hypothetical protein